LAFSIQDSRSGADLSPAGDIEIVRAKTEGDFRAIGELRYRCYRAEGLIDENPQGLFLDEFDHTPGASVFGVYLKGKIVSSIRLHVLNGDGTRSATLEAFSDILEPMVASGLVLVDGARFVVDPTIGSARLSIAWQTLNICLRVAEDIEADYGVAAVQLSHIKLYQKIYNFTQIADPRDYCQLNTKLALIGVDLRIQRAARARKA
jgi:hypothetical protein